MAIWLKLNHQASSKVFFSHFQPWQINNLFAQNSLEGIPGLSWLPQKALQWLNSEERLMLYIEFCFGKDLQLYCSNDYLSQQLKSE
jgi:hypothetical protein